MKWNLFHVNKEAESYVWPIAKMLICAAISVLVINRGNIINRDMNALFDLACSIVGILCLFCIVISVCELTIVHDNRGKKSIFDKRYEKSKKIPIEDIIAMVEKYDIMEYEIVFEGKVIGIGSMSDSEPGRSDFFDKCFYVGKEEFTEIGDFIKAVQPYVDENGEVLVITVNEGPPR